MNDEIKEILSLLNSSSWSNEAKQIEDYITNLQQENERLKEENALINDRNNDYRRTKEYYKSRCEKADEKIKKHLYDKKFLNHIHTNEQMLNIVSNILNGRSDE